MQNATRSFALIVVLCLLSASSLLGERAGTNPHPQVVAAEPSGTMLQVIAYTVLSYLR